MNIEPQEDVFEIDPNIWLKRKKERNTLSSRDAMRTWQFSTCASPVNSILTGVYW